MNGKWTSKRHPKSKTNDLFGTIGSDFKDFGVFFLSEMFAKFWSQQQIYAKSDLFANVWPEGRRYKFFEEAWRNVLRVIALEFARM